jgi:hypothetical protein
MHPLPKRIGYQADSLYAAMGYELGKLEYACKKPFMAAPGPEAKAAAGKGYETRIQPAAFHEFRFLELRKYMANVPGSCSSP